MGRLLSDEEMKAGQEGKHPTSVFRIGEGPLDAIFSPRNVAVVGATDKAGSVGRTILWNLISSPFGGTVFPVNPKRSGVLGVKAYPNVGSLPEPVDLAVIVTPSPTVPGVIRECVAAGVKGAVVISAGFKEIGAQGAELEREIQREARKGRMRIIGPNCLGVMRPHTGLNATFASTIARPGRVGFISQSGALCTAILDWSLRVNVGFSAFISIGSMLDVSWGDLIDYLGDDPKTESIVLYMEAIGDARSFLSAAREVALKKPIIVIKAGRTEAAAKAAVSHTGALVGSDKVLDAAFHRSGVIRVNTIAELFYMAEVLSKQPRPKGPNLAIVTNAGGPGVLATDALIHSGGELAKLSPETMEALNGILPSHWSRNNPVDVLGDAGPERYAKSVEIVGKDPNVDGMLVVLTPQAMTDPTRTAECLEPYARSLGKPVLASWMGAAEIARGEEILNASGIPTFDYPDTAARLFSLMWQHSESLDSLYETPSQTPDGADPKAKESVRGILNGILDSGRVLLTEAESKDLLSAYGIPAVPTSVARSEDEAAASAERTGYPVVLKLFSTTVTHKTDVGGVRLNLKNEESVRRAFQDIRRAVGELRGPEHFMGVTVQPMILTADGYELILGSSIDAQFGPVLLFGSGGQLVEIFKDQTVALPPLNTTLARRMMEKTRIYKALGGVRGRPPVDLGALERVLVRFSQLVADERRIKEIDINPLFASGDKLWVLDARVILYPREVKDEQIPKLAVRPYPDQYVSEWQGPGGSALIRPIRPDDEPRLAGFHGTLSERSVYWRYFHEMNLNQRTAHERLRRVCFMDFDRGIALVAERRDPATGGKEIIGIGRLTKLHGINAAEFGLLIADRWQGKGVGTEILRRLIGIGRDEKLERIVADILPENADMQSICKKLGFQITRNGGDKFVRAVLDL